MSPEMSPEALAAASPHSPETEPLPPADALLAGTLALLTVYAHSAAGCPHRPQMAAKLRANFSHLAVHPHLSAALRTVVNNLRLRWQLERDGQQPPSAAVQATPLWHGAPAGIQ